MAFDPTSTVSAVASAPSMSEAGPASLITTGLWFAVIVLAKRNVDERGRGLHLRPAGMGCRDGDGEPC